jgi:hypothetical protein
MNSLLFPFHLAIDPMSRLLLINFEKNPDAIYMGFEPQVFDDEINGKGHLVIGWRKDGKVDVYHQPSLSPNPKKYDIAGKGLANIKSTSFERAHFVLTDSGVEVSYSFTDLSGRAIRIHIHEKDQKQRKPFDLLAPMGDAAESPSSFPLILLFDFYFVRKKNTVFTVQINEKKHRADAMPFWLDGSKVFFTRYSFRPLIATLNPAFQGEIFPFQVSEGELSICINEQEFHLKEHLGKLALDQIKRVNSIAPLEMHFNPPFPNLAQIAEGSVQGKFKLISKSSIGSVEGTYWLESQGNQIQVRINPSKGWIPNPDRLFLKFLYWAAKPFKNWPKTYQWDASINFENGSYLMDSKWKRIR